MNELLNTREDDRAQDLFPGRGPEAPAQEPGGRRENPHRPADAKGQVSAQAASEFGQSLAESSLADAGEEEERRGPSTEGEMDGGVDAADDGDGEGMEEESEEDEDVEEEVEEEVDDGGDGDDVEDDGAEGDDGDDAEAGDGSGEPGGGEAGSGQGGDGPAGEGSGDPRPEAAPGGGPGLSAPSGNLEVHAGPVAARATDRPSGDTPGASGGGPGGGGPKAGGPAGARGGRAARTVGAKAPTAAALQGGSEQVEERLGAASATEFVLLVGGAGAALTRSLRDETEEIARSVPTLHATMPGENAAIAGGRARVQDPGSDRDLADPLADREPETPDPVHPAPQPVEVQGVQAPNSIPEATPVEQILKFVGDLFSQVNPSADAVSTDVGAPPVAVLIGAADPARAASQEAEAQATLDSALAEHGSALDMAPGEELVQRQELDAAFEGGPLVSEAVPDVVAGEDARWYAGVPIDPAVRARADGLLGAQGLDADQAEMHAEMDAAILERDTMRSDAVREGQADVTDLNEEARLAQEEAVASARGDIARQREEIHDRQRDAIAQARDRSDRAAREVEGEIEARRSRDQARIDGEYQKAQQEADAERAKAEAKAAEEKRKAEEESKDDGWLSSIGNAVGDFFEGLADIVGGIFDALSEVVSGIISAVSDLACSIIDGLCEFACGLLDSLASLVKGFITEVVGQVFPELARDFCAFVDEATAAAKDGIRSAADGLKSAVKSAAATVNSTIQAGIRVARAGITTGLRVAGKVAQGDFEGAAFALLEGALDVAGISHEAFYGFVGRSLDTIRLIVDDPGAFIGNLASAVGQGFEQFQGNFVDHLLNGVVGWLTGQLGDAGIQLPSTWDAAGIFELVISVLGVTEDKILDKLEKKVGKENREVIEESWKYIKSLISGGFSGLWETVKSQVGSLWDLLIDGVQGFLVEKVVTAAITKIATMWNPVGAIVQALIMAWDVYNFVRNEAARIATMVRGVVESLGNIARGQIGDAANAVEDSMARAIPIAISFLASLLGLDGISKKVAEILRGFREKVDRGLDWLLDKAWELGKKGFAAVSKLFSGDKAAVAAADPAKGEGSAAPAAAPATQKPDPKKLPEGPMVTAAGAMTLRVAVSEGSEVGIVQAEGAWQGPLGAKVLPAMEAAIRGKPESPDRAVALSHHQGAQLGVMGVQGRVHDYLVGKPNLPEVEASMRALVEHVLLSANFIGAPGKADSPPPVAAGALGDTIAFAAGAEQHKLWVQNEGGQVAVMMASVPTRVQDKVAELRPHLATLPKEERQRAGAAIGKVIAIERKLDQMARDLALGKAGDTSAQAALEAKKQELAAAIAELLLVLPAEASRAAFDMDMSLKGDNWKKFEQQFIALYAKMGKTPAAGEAEGIWRQVATVLVATTQDFASLKGADGRVQWDKDKAVLDKVLEQFNPLLQALDPAMRQLSSMSSTWAFWSGDPGKDAAVQNGVNALEASALGAAFDGINIDGQWNMQLWAALSRAYAGYAAEQVQGREFIGFFGRKPADQSVVNKIEQPKFRSVTGERFGATPKIDAFAAAGLPWIDRFPKADMDMNGGRPGTYGSHGDANSAGLAAEAENQERRTLYLDLRDAIGEGPAQTEARGKRAPALRAARDAARAAAGKPKADPNALVQVPPGASPVGGAPVPGVLGPGTGDPHVVQPAQGAVAPRNADPKVQGAGAVAVPEGRNGRPASAPGQGGAVGEGHAVQNGGVDHPPTGTDASKAVKADPALLPALPWKDPQGEDHTIAVERVGGKAEVVKHSQPTIITNAFDIAQSIKADTDRWLTLDAQSKESQELLQSIRGDMARLLRVMDENRAPTDLAKKRQAWEAKLGAFSMRHGAALGASQELCDKIWVVLSGLAAETKAKEQSVDDRLVELAQSCGKKLDSGFAGAIGKEYDKIEAVLKGGGNLRERCLLAYNFQDVLGAVAPTVTVAKLGEIFARVQGKAREVELLKERAGLTKPGDKKNTKALFGSQNEVGNDAFNEGMKEFAAAKRPDQVTGKEMDDKLPAIPLAALPESDLRALARSHGISGWDKKDPGTLASELAAKRGDATSGRGEGNVLARSARKREESDVALSGQEGAAVSFRGEDFLPFIEGELANLVDERNAWIRRARELQMPIKAGISGTTHRFMNFAKTMGASSMPSVRLAMLGYLLPMNAHSFHEIMTASRGHAGCTYEAGHYSPLDPLTEPELSSLAPTPKDWEAIRSPVGPSVS